MSASWKGAGRSSQALGSASSCTMALPHQRGGSPVDGSSRREMAEPQSTLCPAHCKGETASPLSSGLGLSQTQSSPLVLAPGPPCHPLISSPASLQYSLFFAPQTQVLRTEFPLLPFNSAPLPTSLRLSPHCKAPCPLLTLLMRGPLSECQSLESAPIYLASVTVP